MQVFKFYEGGALPYYVSVITYLYGHLMFGTLKEIILVLLF